MNLLVSGCSRYGELRLATGRRFSNQRALGGTCCNELRLRFELGGDAEPLGGGLVKAE